MLIHGQWCRSKHFTDRTLQGFPYFCEGSVYDSSQMKKIEHQMLMGINLNFELTLIDSSSSDSGNLQKRLNVFYTILIIVESFELVHAVAQGMVSRLSQQSSFP